MTLAEAIAHWLETMARDDSVSKGCAESRAPLLACLIRYGGKNLRLDAFAPARVRDFLARWFIENAGISANSASPGSPPIEFVEAAALMDSLAAFVDWAARNAAFIDAIDADACLMVINELRERVPRAQVISARLSEYTAARGGAFGFPEFLTSFEAGGQSQYDLDTPGEPGCLEGYFRIIRIEGFLVEAEDQLTETVVWPILFPEPVATLLENDYIINLELVLTQAGWQIAACGFAYPPGTEL